MPVDFFRHCMFFLKGKDDTPAAIPAYKLDRRDRLGREPLLAASR
jgi:hypothetical protein